MGFPLPDAADSRQLAFARPQGASGLEPPANRGELGALIVDLGGLALKQIKSHYQMGGVQLLLGWEFGASV